MNAPAHWPPEAQALWQRIRAFEWDRPGKTSTFSQRLAHEQGWTMDFTQQAIGEYRRFAFLVVVSGRMLSPSPAVDAVWHQHLLYTVSYWEVWCPEVLGMRLHHHPSEGGKEARHQLDLAYQATWQAYHHWFGHPPPVSVWPLPGQPATSWQTWLAKWTAK